MEVGGTVLYTHGLVVRPLEDEYYLVYSPHAVKHCVVNQFGKRVLEVCHGRTCQGVARALNLEQPAREALACFVDELCSSGIISTHEGEPSTAVSVSRAFQLQSASLALTEACNLRCLHCFLPDGGQARTGEISLECVLRAIDDFAALGERPSYTLTGGEVMLRRHKLWGIIDHLRRNDLASTILVLSNGTLITEEDAEMFVENRVGVQISLDGSRPSVHDTIRNSASFESAVGTIRTLLDHDVHTSICITVMRPNLHDLENTVQLALDMGVHKVQFQPLCILGSARIHSSELQLSLSEACDIMGSAKSLAEDRGVWGFEPCSHYSVYEGKRVRPCDMGAYLYMTSDGDLYPCAGLMHPDMLLGDVEEGFPPDRWQTHPTLEMLRNLTVDDFVGCTRCDVKYICGGGCRGDALHASGEVTGANPFCSMERRLIWGKLSSQALCALHKRAMR